MWCERLLVFLACLFLNLGMALAQIRVSGTVVSSDDGEPIMGKVSILVQGTKTGAVTDVDGNFQLTAPTGSKLVASYLGMRPKTVAASSSVKLLWNPDNVLTKLLLQLWVLLVRKSSGICFSGTYI